MPSPIDNLFSLLQEKKFVEIIELIKVNQDFVNGVNPANGNSLLQCLLRISKPNEQTDLLIQFIITHPKFNLSYENKEIKTTNIDELLSFARLDIIKSIIKNPKIVFNEYKLTYESAKERLEISQRALEKDLQKNPSSDSSKRLILKVSKLEEIISLLRDATILYALEKDDASLLERLKNAGAKPFDKLGKLGDNQYPCFLLKPMNNNVAKWFKSNREQTVEKIASNPNSFHNKEREVTRLQAQLAELKIQHDEAKTKVYSQGVDAKIQRIDKIIGTPSVKFK